MPRVMRFSNIPFYLGIADKSNSDRPDSMSRGKIKSGISRSSLPDCIIYIKKVLQSGVELLYP